MLKKLIDSILRFFGLLKEKVTIESLERKEKDLEKKLDTLEKKKEEIDENKTLDANIDYLNKRK